VTIPRKSGLVRFSHSFLPPINFFR